MTAITMKRLPNGMLAPSDAEAHDYVGKLKTGQDVRVKVTRARNLAFHRKYFALLKLAFDYWEPKPVQTRHGVEPEKDFDQFRKDVAILAGFYHASYRLNGDVRIDAKTIAFGAMSADEFERLYDKSIDVLLRLVLPHMSEAELRASVESMLLEFV